MDDVKVQTKSLLCSLPLNILFVPFATSILLITVPHFFFLLLHVPPTTYVCVFHMYIHVYFLSPSPPPPVFDISFPPYFFPGSLSYCLSISLSLSLSLSLPH